MLVKKLNHIFSQTPRQLPLQAVLIVPFVLQIFAAVGLVGYLSFRNGQKAVNDVATQLRSEVSDRVQQYLDSYSANTLLINKLNADAVKRGELNFNSNESTGKTEEFLWQQMNVFNWVSWIYLGSAQGELVGFTRRIQDNSLNRVAVNKSTKYKLYYYEVDSRGKGTGKIVEKTAKKFETLQRPWYKGAEQKKQPIWSEVYLDFASRKPMITASWPIYNDSGKLEGVMGVDLFLEAISKLISNLKIGRSGQVFIIERSGLLVASSTQQKLFTLPQKPGEEPQRIKASDSSDITIKATAQNLIQRFGGLSNIQGKQQLEFMLSGDRQFLQVMPFKDSLGLDWLVVAVVPEADFMEQINSNTQTTILLCAAALIVATAVGFLTAKSVIGPLLSLNKAAKEIATGKFDRTVDIERSDEIGELATSFNNMAKQLQESFTALEAKNADLQRLDQLKDEFLANTSHELRTPLNGMIGIAESMIDGATGEIAEIQRKNLLMIALSGRRLANLVNDVLDFSKLRHKHLELQLKPVDLRSVTNVVLTLSQPLAIPKNLQLINSIPADFPSAEADENRLQQILHNLVGNAIKFTSSGTVEVSAKIVINQEDLPNEKGIIAITISDTGIGIPEDKFDRVFESFEQAEGSTAREYGGTGLGLAVVKQLVQLHGGEITVKSQVGEGSQFTFTLPISSGEVTQIATNIPLKETPNFSLLEIQSQKTELTSQSTTDEKAVKVLVVDDEPINRQVLLNNLSLHNYTITQASNGEEALTLIEQGLKPDIILLDVMMPKMTGYEVTQKLRQRFPSTELPIILLTAKTQVQDIVTGLNSGANDYLAKPVAKDELLARIRTQLNMSRLRAENLRMGAELDVTRKLQQMILPKPEELEALQDLEIAGFMEPADEVGGDYYDVLQQDGKVKIGIGDVTGHGLESGMLMLMAQTAVRTLLESNQTDPVQFLDILNRTLYGNLQRIDSPKNMTLALVDYANGTLSLSGQHEEMIVVRSGGEVQLIDTMDLGFPIGLDDEIAEFIAQQRVQLHPGDVVVLYTDGITEAYDINREQYGLERLCEVIRRNCEKSAQEIKQAVIQELRQYIGSQKVFDDITLVVIKQK